MLTENQKERLFELINKCEDLPLKNLISTACNQWINGNISPKRNDFGAKVTDGKYDTIDQHCCLITASMIGEESSFDSRILHSGYRYFLLNKNLKFDTVSKYGVPLQEINRIINLFDGETTDSDSTGLIIRELYEILFL